MVTDQTKHLPAVPSQLEIAALSQPFDKAVARIESAVQSQADAKAALGDAKAALGKAIDDEKQAKRESFAELATVLKAKYADYIDAGLISIDSAESGSEHDVTIYHKQLSATALPTFVLCFNNGADDAQKTYIVWSNDPSIAKFDTDDIAEFLSYVENVIIENTDIEAVLQQNTNKLLKTQKHTTILQISLEKFQVRQGKLLALQEKQTPVASAPEPTLV